MAQSPIKTSRRTRWIGVATALMSALAGGAMWCLIALYARHDLMALSLPIAGLVAWALRSHGYAGDWFGAIVAAVSTLLASAYSLYLQASAQVASMLGLPLRQALRQMEPRMALDIMWANLDFVGAGILVAALAVAAIATVWSRRENPAA